MQVRLHALAAGQGVAGASKACGDTRRARQTAVVRWSRRVHHRLLVPLADPPVGDPDFLRRRQGKGDRTVGNCSLRMFSQVAHYLAHQRRERGNPERVHTCCGRLCWGL